MTPFRMLAPVLLSGVSALVVAPADQALIYIGTYTEAGKSKGIHAFRLDPGTGALTPLGLAAETRNPSFLAVHSTGRWLYAVNETHDGPEKSGAVTAFTIDRASGMLTRLNDQPSRGGDPCYLVVDRSGSSVLVANYSGGNVAVLPIGADGRLGPAASVVQHTGSSVNASRQGEPHAHSINVDSTNRYAVAADLGIDKLLIYKFDPKARTLSAADPAFVAAKPGAGPRHFTFHPNGRLAFAINELDSTITAYRWDGAKGTLSEVGSSSTLPAGFAESNSTAEVQVHPSGRFVYGSNRGHDSIAVFALDQATGRLTPVEHEPTQGRTPRNFGIDPTGTFLLAANQRSDSVVVFRIDPATGALTSTGTTVTVGAPVCVKFVQ
jgi:6-phosphogluconolactonase